MVCGEKTKKFKFSLALAKMPWRPRKGFQVLKNEENNIQETTFSVDGMY
jgi:hypothetical protein